VLGNDCQPASQPAHPLVRVRARDYTGMRAISSFSETKVETTALHRHIPGSGTTIFCKQFFNSQDFTILQASKFYNFQASLNHRANACSCL
jgi:hypothetical protein